MTILAFLIFLAKWTAASLAATALWAIASLRIAQARENIAADASAGAGQSQFHAEANI